MRTSVRTATSKGEPVRSRTNRPIASSSSQRSAPHSTPLSQSRTKPGLWKSSPNRVRAAPKRQSSTSTARPSTRKLQDLPWASRFRLSLTPPSSA